MDILSMMYITLHVCTSRAYFMSIMHNIRFYVYYLRTHIAVHEPVRVDDVNA